MNDSIECDNKSVLDLSKQQLQKIPKQPADVALHVRILLLDENELQKIDNVDSYTRLEHLSVCKNQLFRMYGVCRLHHLQQLHLAYNGILTIEGMKELSQLRHLNLEGNNIKAIEHLTTNCKLEFLNLAENSIASISDLSYLKCLKELNVQGNRITHLRNCDRFLPSSLETLLLAKNGITDLNEICTLSHLNNLNAISVTDNPCVQMTGSVVGFDYRPFVLNWCMTVKLIDGFIVNAIESLKAEWLYSQGRGRQFRVGEQQPLARYLSSVCPLSGEVLENENERKLRLILSKAQQHQRQLQEESTGDHATTGAIGGGGGNGGSTNSTSSNSPSSARRRQASAGAHGGSRIQSPRFSRLGRQGSPDSMSSSMHGNSSLHDLSNLNNATALQMTSSLISNIKAHDRSDESGANNIMAQSLDPHALNGRMSNTMSTLTDARSSPQMMAMLSSNFSVDNMSLSRSSGNPLSAASKMVPVPESLMSPDCLPTSVNVMQRPSSAAQTPSTQPTRKTIAKLQDSPKSARFATKQRQPSPVLNQTRKVQQNLMNSLQLQQWQAQQLQQQQQLLEQRDQQHQQLLQHALPSSSVHVAPPDANSTSTNSDDTDEDAIGGQQTMPANGCVVRDSDSSGLVDEDCADINVDQLKTIRNKAAQRSRQHRSLAKVAQVQQNRKAKPNVQVDNKNMMASKLDETITKPTAKVQPPLPSAAEPMYDEQTRISAILIQKLWRGHQARLRFKEAAKVMQTQRTQSYIEKLTADMETTKIALENERKIQQLQMQAINALWKKVSNMPTAAIQVSSIDNNSASTAESGASTTNNAAAMTSANAQTDTTAASTINPASQAIVQDLANTCNALSDQVRQLQGSMRDILQCMTAFCQMPPQQQIVQQQSSQSTVTSMVADTQTEIIAVHTPQVDDLPFPFRTRSAAMLTAVDRLEETVDDDSEHSAQVTTASTTTTKNAVSLQTETISVPIKLQRPSTLPLDGTTSSVALLIGDSDYADECCGDTDLADDAIASMNVVANVCVAAEEDEAI